MILKNVKLLDFLNLEIILFLQNALYSFGQALRSFILFNFYINLSTNIYNECCFQERLDKLKNEAVLITPEEKQTITKQFDKSVGLWKKRKRMCINALGKRISYNY